MTMTHADASYSAPGRRSTDVAPTGDRVLIRPDDPERQTAAGLIIPDNAQEAPQRGTILAVGPGRFDDHGHRIGLDFHAGQHVIYSKYGGTEIDVDGETLLIVAERDVLAVLTELTTPD